MASALTLPIFDIQNERDRTLGDIKGDRAMVVDFWHTKCVKCPAALSKMNEEAANEETIFVGCALSLGEGNLEVVKDVVSDWENLTHVFMSLEVKEQAKQIFGFSAVPFVVVFGKGGNILASGDLKLLDIHALLEADRSPAPARMEFVLDEDF